MQLPIPATPNQALQRTLPGLVDNAHAPPSQFSDDLVAGHGRQVHVACWQRRIIDRLVDYCFPPLNKIDQNIESVEDMIFDENAKPRQTVYELSVIRRDIIAYRRIIKPQIAVPFHYGAVVGTDADAEKFKELCSGDVRILKPSL